MLVNLVPDLLILECQCWVQCSVLHSVGRVVLGSRPKCTDCVRKTLCSWIQCWIWWLVLISLSLWLVLFIRVSVSQGCSTDSSTFPHITVVSVVLLQTPSFCSIIIITVGSVPWVLCWVPGSWCWFLSHDPGFVKVLSSDLNVALIVSVLNPFFCDDFTVSPWGSFWNRLVTELSSWFLHWDSDLTVNSQISVSNSCVSDLCVCTRVC